MTGCQVIPAFSAALTPLIAIIALYIAFQQYRTNRDKLRLDLYDRRFALFSAFADLCRSVASSARPGSVELDAFLQFRHKTQFLFDPTVAAFLEKTRLNALRVQYLQKLLDGDLPVGEDRTRASEELSGLMSWFGAQHDDARVHFERYFRFK